MLFQSTSRERFSRKEESNQISKRRLTIAFFVSAAGEKYRKRPLKLVISRIDDNRKASEIIQEVGVLRAISWIKAAWEEVSDQTVINCFRKCGFRNKAQDVDVQTLGQVQDELANLLKELAGDVDPDDYVDFDKDFASLMPAVDEGSIS